MEVVIGAMLLGRRAVAINGERLLLVGCEPDVSWLAMEEVRGGIGIARRRGLCSEVTSIQERRNGRIGLVSSVARR
jgi:hypothetical protein